MFFLICHCRWFLHFYVWAAVFDVAMFFHLLQVLVFAKQGIPLLTNVLLFLTSVNVGQEQSADFNVVKFETVFAVTLLLVQSSRRLYESVFVTVPSKDAKMHFMHYLLGFIFYSLRAPLLVLHLKNTGTGI